MSAEVPFVAARDALTYGSTVSLQAARTGIAIPPLGTGGLLPSKSSVPYILLYIYESMPLRKLVVSIPEPEMVDRALSLLQYLSALLGFVAVRSLFFGALPEL